MVDGYYGALYHGTDEEETREESDRDEELGVSPVVSIPVQNAGDDDIKTNMSNERTFFKWMWTGIHVGSLGTWVLRFFADPTRFDVFLVFLTWVVAFCLMFYGLFRFYGRRWALKNGVEDPGEVDSPLAIVTLTLCVTVTMGGSVLYCVLSAS
mmetsp:Transcript_8451/g.17167  ORF Transcript_8451/g.17167 Transcript_8451/m.17167 type:complete len:153 (-) Transcript_8451:634-1092(-)